MPRRRKWFKVRIDGSCKLCQEAIRRIREIEQMQITLRRAHMDMKLRKRPKLRIILTPDYNANGWLTHWHVDIEE